MEWLDRLRNVMNYIEENIKNDLDIKKLATMANSSEFHFQRVFCILTGYTLKDYIRRRRLSLAACELV